MKWPKWLASLTKWPATLPFRECSREPMRLGAPENVRNAAGPPVPVMQSERLGLLPALHGAGCGLMNLVRVGLRPVAAFPSGRVRLAARIAYLLLMFAGLFACIRAVQRLQQERERFLAQHPAAEPA